MKFRSVSTKWLVLGFSMILLIASMVFTSTINLGESEAQAVVKEYKSKLYNVSYNSIDLGVAATDEYKQFFTPNGFNKFTTNRVMFIPRQVAFNGKYNLQFKDIKFKKIFSEGKNKLLFGYDLGINVLSVNGSNSVVNEIGQVTLVKENGKWKIENDWFNLNDVFKVALTLKAPPKDSKSSDLTDQINPIFKANEKLRN